MPPIGSRRGVTVVVPMYGDPESLRRCLTSLVRHVNSSSDHVLLVNDVGPEADAIEAVVTEVTGGLDHFRYERNPRNLGFVGACNRAALELDTSDRDILLLNSDTETTPGFLDELSAVLHASPQHGVVCPRSNNATIASLPHRLRDPQAVRSSERTLAVHGALAADLPRFSYAPVAMGFCFLVRRELIEAYGLFDEAFSPGYGEENDFCLRMSSHGFSSLIAHRVLVFHLGSRSFSRDRRAKLRAAHERLLIERHPHYPGAVRDYLQRVADPVDVFADALAPADDRPRILIELGQDADVATIVEQRKLVRVAHLAAIRADADVTVAGGAPSVREGLEPTPHLRFAAAGENRGLFDLGVTWASQSETDLALRINRDCARWAVVSGIDPPSWEQRVHEPARVSLREEALAFADAVVMLESAQAPSPDLLLDIARRPVSRERLRERWWFYARLGAHLEEGAPAQDSRPHWLDRHAPRAAAVARKIRRQWRRRAEH